MTQYACCIHCPSEPDGILHFSPCPLCEADKYRGEALRCEECGRAKIYGDPVPTCAYCGSTRLVTASEPPPVVDYRDGDTP